MDQTNWWLSQLGWCRQAIKLGLEAITQQYEIDRDAIGLFGSGLELGPQPARDGFAKELFHHTVHGELIAAIAVGACRVRRAVFGIIGIRGVSVVQGVDQQHLGSRLAFVISLI